MALKEFRGDAPAVADVWSVQITANDAATTYSLTINGKSISVTGQASAADTATALADAWNASTIEEFMEATASADTDTVTITMDTAGIPIEFTQGASGGTGTIGTPSNTVVADGPNFWSAANFGGSLPADGDDVVVRGNMAIYYGLDQSDIQPDSLLCLATSAGNPIIGLPRVNASGGYFEYRDRNLQIGPAYAQLNANSIRLNIDTGTDQTAIEVYSGVVGIAGSNASSTLEVFGGTVNVATEAGQSAQFTSIAIGGTSSVTISENVTVATVQAYGTSSCYVNCAATTFTMQDNPRVTLDGSGTITTANVRGGTVDHRSSGTIATLNGGGGTIDFRNNLSGVTVTNANFSKGFTIDDTNNKVTWTNAYTIQNGNLRDITHRTGRNVTVKVTAA